jgi:hypothetical protein
MPARVSVAGIAMLMSGSTTVIVTLWPSAGVVVV